MAINNVVLTGRLVRDPELKKTSSDVPFTGFVVAVDRQYKNGEERQADFISCTAWRGTAEFICKYFHKGDGIGVVGSLQTRTWDKDGEKRYATEVLVQGVSFLDGKKKDGDTTATEQNFEEVDAADGDLPF